MDKDILKIIVIVFAAVISGFAIAITLYSYNSTSVQKSMEQRLEERRAEGRRQEQERRKRIAAYKSYQGKQPNNYNSIRRSSNRNTYTDNNNLSTNKYHRYTGERMRDKLYQSMNNEEQKEMMGRIMREICADPNLPNLKGCD